MKKFYKAVCGALSAITLAACLNPIGFKPEILLKVESTVEGEISLVSSDAVLVIHNHTATLDITSVSIRDTELDATVGFAAGKPKAGYQKSFNLRPKAGGYEVTFEYQEIKPNTTANTSASKPAWDWGGKPKVLEVALPVKGLYNLHFFRKMDGSIGATTESREYEMVKDGRGNISTMPDTEDEGEGKNDSGLGVKELPRFGLLIVKNLTSINTDLVSFNFYRNVNGEDQSVKTYTMSPGPERQDQRSIVLGPHDWKFKINYQVINPQTQQLAAYTTAEKVATVSAGQISYAFFYKSKTGYGISTIWPPVPNDADDGNSSPSDIVGDTEGILQITNRSRREMLITNTQWLGVEYPTQVAPEETQRFVLPAGTGPMYLKTYGNDYGMGLLRTIRPQQTLSVVYTDGLEDPSVYNPGGGLVRLENLSYANVLSVGVLDPLGTGGIIDEVLYSSFMPSGKVGYAGRASVKIDGTPAKPILPRKQYAIQVNMETASGPATIERYAELYEKVVVIQITQSEVENNTNHGAYITIHNDSDQPVQGVYITNVADPMESAVITSDDFNPVGAIKKGTASSFRIKSTRELPILPGRKYEFRLTLGTIGQHIFLYKTYELYDKNIDIWITQQEVLDKGGGGGAKDPFQPVTNISGIRSVAEVGESFILGENALVEPVDATKKDIVWSVIGTNNADVTITTETGNAGKVQRLTVNSFRAPPASDPNQITLLATIQGGGEDKRDYSKPFTILIYKPVNKPQYISVIDITGIPKQAKVDTSVNLNGTINPSDAKFADGSPITRSHITWAITGGVGGASVNADGKKFLAKKEGQVIVTATIPNGIEGRLPFVKDFTINVKAKADSGKGNIQVRFMRSDPGGASTWPIKELRIYSTTDHRGSVDTSIGKSDLEYSKMTGAGARQTLNSDPPRNSTHVKTVTSGLPVNLGSYIDIGLPLGHYYIVMKDDRGYYSGYTQNTWFYLDLNHWSDYGRSGKQVIVKMNSVGGTIRF